MEDKLEQLHLVYSEYLDYVLGNYDAQGDLFEDIENVIRNLEHQLKVSSTNKLKKAIKISR